MERKDFKEILPKHIELCKKLIEFNGYCDEARKALGNISCRECPFSINNSTKGKLCNENGYSKLAWRYDEAVTKSAKEFIKLFEKDFQPKVTERIEDTQEFKDKHKHQPNLEATVDSTTEFLREMREQPTDNIKPNHYKLNIKGQDIEVMDIIDAVVKDMDGRKGYIVGNILKYVCRAEKKNGLEDYKKARTYLDMLIEGIK